MVSKDSISDFVRYLFVGGIAALTDLAIFFVFAKLLDYNYLVITIIGFAIATYVNYILSIKFVFNSRARFSRRTEITLTYIVSTIALVVHMAVLYYLIDLLNSDKMLSKILAIGSAFIFNFLLRKYYVFKKIKD